MRPEPRIVRAAELDWTQSPSPGVWRKRYFHEGPAEAGKVSSLVRYEPGAKFSEHDHLHGEEILVLDGIFSDSRGDFGSGHYMLSGQGFRHQPFTRDGCLIFVRLRQYPGSGRESFVFDSAGGEWASRGFPGARRRFLYQSEQHPEEMWLTRLDPGVQAPTVQMPHGEEIFVVQGRFTDEYGQFSQHDWLRFPPGGQHTPHTREGCLLYVARSRGRDS